MSSRGTLQSCENCKTNVNFWKKNIFSHCLVQSSFETNRKYHISILYSWPLSIISGFIKPHSRIIIFVRRVLTHSHFSVKFLRSYENSKNSNKNNPALKIIKKTRFGSFSSKCFFHSLILLYVPSIHMYNYRSCELLLHP